MADRKYKFRVGEKAVIFVPEGKVTPPKEQHKNLLDSPHQKYPGRRRSGPAIRFYDLAQVNNNESLSDAPAWSDHPILKTPSYSTSADVSDVDFFQGVIYSVDPFVDADFQAYTDMMFNYPVTEWTKRYRRITLPNPFAAITPTNTDERFSMVDSGMTALDEVFCKANTIVSPGTVDYPGTKAAALAARHWVYELTKNASIYRGLDDLVLNNYAWNGDELVTPGYFGMSTENKSRFKVTAVNDHTAADVGPLNISGPIDAFLMPQIGFTLATSNSSDWKTTEALGLCYQVMPRHLWPLYVTPGALGTGSQWGSDTDVSNYIDYLTHRSGIQYSVWSFTGVVNAPFDYSFSEASFAPTDWTGQSSWAFACNGGADNFYYSMFPRSGPILDGQTSYSTVVEANSTDDVYGVFELFRNYSPFLSCVFKMGGQFYYVWDISGSLMDFEGNYTVDQTVSQQNRYRINRGVNWDGDYISTTPAVRDGSGPDYDLQTDFP